MKELFTELLDKLQNVYNCDSMTDALVLDLDKVTGDIIKSMLDSSINTNLFNNSIRSLDRLYDLDERRYVFKQLKKNIYFKGDKLGLFFTIYLYLNNNINDYKFIKSFKRLYENLPREDLYDYESSEFGKLYDYLNTQSLIKLRLGILEEKLDTGYVELIYNNLVNNLT